MSIDETHLKETIIQELITQLSADPQVFLLEQNPPHHRFRIYKSGKHFLDCRFLYAFEDETLRCAISSNGWGYNEELFSLGNPEFIQSIIDWIKTFVQYRPKKKRKRKKKC